ncbi:MAG: hypothetical protein SVO01_10065 [Thermotogota bacterium]|nr:hypothetical protein [Thermotogota bacterium]
MISTSIVTLTSVYAASPMTVFLKLDANGQPIFTGENKTSGMLTVMSNTTGKDGTTYTDTYEIRVVGENMLSIAALIEKGKELSIEAYISSWPEDTGKVTATGKPITKLRYGLTLKSINFLADSANRMTELLTKCFQGLEATGILPPNINHAYLATEAVKSLRTKDKARPFNMDEAIATGKFNKASIWTKEKGMWNAEQTTPNASMSPELLQKLLEQALNAQAAKNPKQAQPDQNAPQANVAASPNIAGETGDAVWDVPF